jgi:hypothetical protein
MIWHIKIYEYYIFIVDCNFYKYKVTFCILSCGKNPLNLASPLLCWVLLHLPEKFLFISLFDTIFFHFTLCLFLVDNIPWGFEFAAELENIFILIG